MNKAKALNLKVSLQRDENVETYTSENTLYISGQLEVKEGHNGMRYMGMVKIVNKEGKLSATAKDVNIKDADEVALYVSLATNYNGVDHEKLVSDLLNKAEANYSKLKKKHIEKYQSLFNRVDLSLDKNKNSKRPLNKHLEAFETDKTDYSLAALYMQYGRYLLISSTRPGGLPTNLQGLWAPQIHTPWNGNYHLNINLQMNL